MNKVPVTDDQRLTWKRNYFRIRSIHNAIGIAMQYRITSEGELPTTSPTLIMAAHQTTIDHLALMKIIPDYLAFVFSVEFPLNRKLQRFADAMGAVLIRRPKDYSAQLIQYKRLFRHFDNDGIVVGFPQGNQQHSEVSKVNSGLVRLVEMYEKQTGRQISIVPTGVAYESPRGGLTLIRSPMLRIPSFKTQITVNFGESQYLTNKTPEKLTEIVMRDAAALSNIPYRA